MALLGRGAMVIWHDLVEGTEADYHAWHSREHLGERVGIPGFRRGRRYTAIDGAPGFCILYEVDELSTLTSKAYRDRLNDPTPWTRASLVNFRNVNRTLCVVRESFGLGVGAVLLTLCLSPQPGRAKALGGKLGDSVLPDLAEAAGMSAAHLLVGDRKASAQPSLEKSLRDRPDEIADWIILVEGYDEAALTQARAGSLSPAALARHGAEPPVAQGLYRLAHG
ncbi:MAG: hypothetical protein ACE5JZ_09130, partial [Kiloniellales bacterium]